MPDKKLTDSEIIKDCKNCIRYTTCIFCIIGGRSISKDCNDFVELDTINRLQAENERLKDLCADCSMLKGKIETISDLQKQIEYWQRGYNDLRQELKTAKAEAIKEFAERLCEDRVSNDPVVIAVKTELKFTGE